MSRVELRRLWEGRIRTFLESGQSAAAWCSEQDINVHQFRYWMQKFSPSNAPASTSVRWLSVDVRESPSPENRDSSGLTVCVGEWRVEVPDNFNPQALQRVVQVLSELC